MLISEMDGQGLKQFIELGSAFLLSAAIGLEREIRHKSAGLRTYTVVGTSAALFLLISKYGFMNVLGDGRVVLDPSRVAAQIVTGIGFIGAGLIFVRRTGSKDLRPLPPSGSLQQSAWPAPRVCCCSHSLSHSPILLWRLSFPYYCASSLARQCPPNRSKVQSVTSLDFRDTH